MAYGKGIPDFIPSFTYQPVKVSENVVKRFEGKVVVDLGAGGRKIAPWVTTVDFMELPGTDIVCDFIKEKTPFENESVDLVIATGLIEHVEDEDILMKEILRILKPNGTLHIELPFLQQYHDDPIDFRRLTLPGLTMFLDKYGFAVENKGVHIGPTVTILTLISYYISILFSGDFIIHKILSNSLFMLFSVIFWPLRYLDRLLINKPDAHRLAFGIYATAIKR